MQLFCQGLLLAFLCLGLFKGLYEDFHGRTAHAPWGFEGAVITIIVTALLVLIYWRAGALTLLF